MKRVSFTERFSHFHGDFLLAPSLSCETIRKFNGEVVLCDKKDDRLNASDGNLEQFFEFVDKWRANRLAGNKKIDDIFRNSSCE